MNANIFEIERKFLIEFPSFEEAEIVSKSEIEQIYLRKTESRINARIRKRIFEDYIEYTTTQKIRISDIKRIEDERVITKEEYEILKSEADEALNPIIKKRIVVDYNNHLFEIDIYDFWESAAVLEIELKSENEEFEFPPFIKIISELTHDRRFSNHSMAKKIPDIQEYLKKSIDKSN